MPHGAAAGTRHGEVGHAVDVKNAERDGGRAGSGEVARGIREGAVSVAEQNRHSRRGHGEIELAIAIQVGGRDARQVAATGQVQAGIDEGAGAGAENDLELAELAGDGEVELAVTVKVASGNTPPGDPG